MWFDPQLNAAWHERLDPAIRGLAIDHFGLTKNTTLAELLMRSFPKFGVQGSS